MRGGRAARTLQLEGWFRVLALPAAFPPWVQVSAEYRDKALLCGTHTACQGTCSQKWKHTAFPLNVTSPPFNQPPDSFKSGWVGGAVKPQPIKLLMSCRFPWMETSIWRLQVAHTICSVPQGLGHLTHLTAEAGAGRSPQSDLESSSG